MENMVTLHGFDFGKWLRLLHWWLIYMGSPREVTVETFNGVLTFSNKNWLTGKYLYVKKNHEEHEIRAAGALLLQRGWLHKSSPDNTLLNVGANIGMTCIALIKAGYFEYALAFEPEPENFRFLKKNIDQNGLNNRIQAFRLALSSVTGDFTLELSRDNPGDHRLRQSGQAAKGFFGEENRRTIVVPCETLDRFNERRPSHIDAIWVDIQGHEGHFFRGAQSVLKKGIPVVTEFWPYGLARAGTNREELVAILSPLFSHFWVIGNEKFRHCPIHDITRLFDVYCEPRSFGLVLLEPPRHS